jgi:hypothetical protein
MRLQPQLGDDPLRKIKLASVFGRKIRMHEEPLVG